MNKIFDRLYDELEFTRELLGIGLTSLRRANFSNKGAYLQAFSNLSLGLERLMKLCLILNFYKLHRNFPSEQEIRQYGHHLDKLFERISEIKISAIPDLEEQIHHNIISHLTEFALGSGTRYSNINFVVNNDPRDPIYKWATEIDDLIWDKYIPQKRKSDLEDKIRLTEMLWNSVPTVINFESDRRKPINTINSLAKNSVYNEEIAGYRVLFSCQIIEHLIEVLNSINNALPENDYLPIGRVFATITYGSNSDKRKRRNFIRMV